MKTSVIANSEREKTDKVVIVGAGPVGMVAALLLAQQKIAVTVIEKNSAAVVSDGRYLALSYGSLEILKEALRPYSLSLQYEPILQVHTSMAGLKPNVLMDCIEHDLSCLGGVLAYAHLVETLRSAIDLSGVEVLWSTEVVNKTVSSDCVVLDIRSGLGDFVQTAQWLIHAEGGLFNQQVKRAQYRNYEQTAIVALVEMSAAPRGFACERFTRNGPIALLPTRPNQYVSIWTAPNELVKELLALSDDQYLSRLSFFYGDMAGEFISIKSRFSFDLGLNSRDEIAESRSFFMGNSAQTIHPFAGQGFNLGLRDVVVWIDLFSDAQRNKHKLNGLESRYVALRQSDRQSTINLTDSIVRLFRRPHHKSLYGLAALLRVCDVKPIRMRLSRLLMFGSR